MVLTVPRTPFLRHYFGRDFEAALASWGILAGQIAALTDVRKMIARLVESAGSKYEVYFLDHRADLVVLFENDTDRAAAWVHWGHVDHRAHLMGSELAPHGVWRTRLPTTDGSAAPHARTASEVRHRTCAHCYMPVPLTGICDTCDR